MLKNTWDFWKICECFVETCFVVTEESLGIELTMRGEEARHGTPLDPTSWTRVSS